MELLNQIVVILSLVLPLIGTAITFFIKHTKSIKLKKIAEDTLKVTYELCNLVQIAETIGSLTGVEKKTYVLGKIEKFCIANSIEFDLDVAEKHIEHLIALSKSVNAKQNDS